MFLEIQMKYTIKNTVDDVFWKEIVDNSPIATFYHTPAWSKILSDTFPKWKNATLGFDFEDGNRAVFPMLRRSILDSVPIYWYESIAPGAYGGPIFRSSPSSEHYEAIDYELSRYNNIVVVGNPFSDWYPSGNFSKYETFIQLLPLTQDFDRVWKNYSKGRRHTINYAKRNGVSVREVDFLEYFQDYYEIYQLQLKRWKRSATDYYPLRLFKNLAKYAKSNPDIKLWTAWLDNKMISGLVVFYHHDHLVTWHGATLEDYFEYRPVDILYSTVIEAACQSGCKVFDFANSGGHKSVVEYKERFGAIGLPLAIYRHRNLGGILYRGVRHLNNYLGKCPEE
jgi:hypothetical protein